MTEILKDNDAPQEASAETPLVPEQVTPSDRVPDAASSEYEAMSERELEVSYNLDDDELIALESTPTVSFGDAAGGALFSPGACFVCTGHLSLGSLFNIVLSLLFLGFLVASELLEFFPLPGLLFLFSLTILLWIGSALGTRDKAKAMVPGGRLFLASFSVVTFWFPIILSMVIASNFVMQQTWMANDKMLPQIHKGDTVLVDRLSYKLEPVERGDLVLIQELYNDNGNVNRRSFFARVIALPGDLI